MEKISEPNVMLAVIVPAYNVEKTIESCIKSLLIQTYKAKEIIVVDDGSKDNTLSILTELGKSDKTIKIIHQENKGVSAARNAALDNVSPEITHICFVDADDTVKPDFLKYFAENIEKGKLVIQGFIKLYRGLAENVLCDQNENILKQISQKGDLGHTVDKCFEMHIIRKYNLHFNEQFTFAEDEAFVLDYMQYVPNLKYVDIAQYEYMIPLVERAYTKDNNMGMYFYCLSKMATICQKLNQPLHDIYKNRLYRCGKQFFKPSNFKRNTVVEIKSYFHSYISNTQSIPIFFSKWHFTIILIYKFKMENLYIKLMSKVFNR